MTWAYPKRHYLPRTRRENPLMLPTKARLVDAAKRAVRSFVGTFAAAIAAGQLDIYDVSAEKALLVSAGSAAAALFLRLVLDPTPVPSLGPKE